MHVRKNLIFQRGIILQVAILGTISTYQILLRVSFAKNVFLTTIMSKTLFFLGKFTLLDDVNNTFF